MPIFAMSLIEDVIVALNKPVHRYLGNLSIIELSFIVFPFSMIRSASSMISTFRCLKFKVLWVKSQIHPTVPMIKLGFSFSIFSTSSPILVPPTDKWGFKFWTILQKRVTMSHTCFANPLEGTKIKPKISSPISSLCRIYNMDST